MHQGLDASHVHSVPGWHSVLHHGGPLVPSVAPGHGAGVGTPGRRKTAAAVATRLTRTRNPGPGGGLGTEDVSAVPFALPARFQQDLESQGANSQDKMQLILGHVSPVSASKRADVL